MSGILALVCIAASLAAHALVLGLTPAQDAIGSPIPALSRTPAGNLQTLGLLLFAAAQVTIAAGLGRIGHGILWQTGRLLLGASAVLLVHLAWRFANVDMDMAARPALLGPLSLLASLLGLAMGALGPGLLRHARPLGILGLVLLATLLLSVGLLPMIGSAQVGAYERGVGLVLAAWLTLPALALARRGVH